MPGKSAYFSFRGEDAMVRKLKKLANIGAKLSAELLIVADKTAKSLERNIEDEAPEKTGTLKRKIKIRRVGASLSYSFILNIPVDYSSFVLEGTQPHLIQPKNAKVLAFYIGGQHVFSKIVKHPGTQPNPFDERGLDKSKGDIHDYLAEMRQRLFSGL